MCIRDSHNKVPSDGEDIETQFPLESFPQPIELWERYKKQHNIKNEEEELIVQPNHTDSSGKEPRYYQVDAINRTIEAIAKGEKRILLVMATGTGKTYTTFQIIWRMWKARIAKRVFFFLEKKFLANKTRINDFKPFGSKMKKKSNQKIDPA